MKEETCVLLFLCLFIQLSVCLFLLFFVACLVLHSELPSFLTEIRVVVEAFGFFGGEAAVGFLSTAVRLPFSIYW